MTYTLADLIPSMLAQMPSLKDAPGFEPIDMSNPYVAFAMFRPFALENIERLTAFLGLVNNIYNETSDLEVINLVHIDIFPDLATNEHSKKHELWKLRNGKGG